MMKMRNALCLLVTSLSLLFPNIGNAGGGEFQSLDGAWQIVFGPGQRGQGQLHRQMWQIG